ncbi:hypothetical protein SIN8267_00600 [Sinobacterium norvegicum]|uniref:EamA domain-containing protein n=1 Tax=Sinobacterium norvegicum TaxID=1641715 RepID=A0ABN8EDT1_9GAMM|nr:DMT family transporter [Sinobacterium norvegicum]CAH0990508.1 hypothetical protein SIN8267_00600 [Sinobacterium norvegicum]
MSVPIAYLAVVVVWSTTPLAIKWSSDSSVTPFAAVSARMFIAAVIACVVVALFRANAGLKRENIKHYCVASLGIFPTMPLVYWGAQFIPSGLISVIYALSPFLITLITVVFFGAKQWSIMRYLALSIALGGLLLVSIDQWLQSGVEGGYPFVDIAWAILAVFGATVLFSLSSVLVKYQPRNIDPLEQTLGTLTFSIPGLVLSWLLLDGSFPQVISTEAMMSTLYLAIVGSLIAYFSFFYVLSALPVSVSGLIPLITPGIAVWLGAVVAGEPVTLMMVLGSVLILLGLLLHELPKWRGDC